MRFPLLRRKTRGARDLREARKEELLLAELLEHASQPFAVGYPDGRLGLMNRAFEQLTGYIASELNTINWSATLTPPEWRELEARKLDELHRTGQPVRYEKEYIRRDGARVPVELLVHLSRDDKGQPEYYYSFVTDISERWRIGESARAGAERLRQSNAELQAANASILKARTAAINLMEDAIAARRKAEQISAELRQKEIEQRRLAQFPEENPNPVLRVEPSGGLLYANCPAREFLDAMATASDASIPSAVQALVNDAYRTHQIVESELTDQRGQIFLFTATQPPGELYVNLYGRDITERKCAEEALRESEEQYRSLFSSMSEGFALHEIVTGPDGAIVDYRFLDANPAFERMTGLRPADIVGRTVREVLPDIEPEWIERYGEVALTGEPTRFESFAGALNRWYEVFAYRPSPRRFAVIFTDVTERRKAEQALRETQKLESIGVLAGGLAHDFNNLLMGVIGNASLAQEMILPGNPIAELLEGVLKTGDQLAHLTRQMLAYSGKGRFIIEPLNLSKLVPEMTSLIQPSIPKKIELRFELADDLPKIEGDPGQIQQVVMNLVLNAAEAIGSGGGLIRLRTGLRELKERNTSGAPPGRYVFLEVHDTGCGMDEETKAKIFDPFFSTKFVGRGLGLAAVSGIVRGHKGTITVTSVPGTGSCFSILLPAAESAVRISDAKARKAEPAGHGTILVVDDEELVREVSRAALERQGYRVFLAGSGPAAIDLAKRLPDDIALVLLDLSMPCMGGEEVLPELRRLRPSARFIVTSGYSEAETMRLFSGQQVSGFLQKPFTAGRLVEKVKSALSS